MHAGISADELAKAKAIKLQFGQEIGSLASGLRDEKIIKGPGGARMNVGNVRAVQASFVKARQYASSKRQAGFAILPN